MFLFNQSLSVASTFLKALHVGIWLNLCTTALAEQPSLMLANTYHNYSNIDIEKYWVSEKLDGVRAYWTGSQLLTRSGNPINAPKPLLNQLPKLPLDGELWSGRNTFEFTSGLVNSQQSTLAEWENTRYMVFDLPNHSGSFDERLDQLNTLASTKNQKNSFWAPLAQFRVIDRQQLLIKLNEIERLGGEGLMLHKANSLYRGERSNDLLKVKSFQDAEATVIGHQTGKGKYRESLGSLIVKTSDGKTFKIGSGFSDKERQSPPPVGSIITFKYFGLTSNGIPRFASFLRIREHATNN